MADEPIISPDTLRGQRLPPGQVQTHKWPVLHEGEIPPFDPDTWTLTLFPCPLVDHVHQWTWPEFLALPRTRVFADMHCVTRWSKLNNLWEGVSTRILQQFVKIHPDARFVMIHCEYGYTTNLPMDDFFAEDSLLAMKHDGRDLEPEHGYPLRLVVPRRYAWKSAKWVRGIEFMTEDRPGYWESWENGGYSMQGDPWAESRYRER